MLRIPEAVQRWLPGRERAPAQLNEKGSRTGALVAFEQLGQPVWSPRDYGHFAREGFMQNAILYRAVRMISEAAASIPLLVYEGGEELEDHPLVDLLRQPSLDHTTVDFLESWYGFLLVAGNAYVEAVALDGTLRELHILRPDRMKVIPGPDGWPEGYEYTAGGQSIRFMDEAVPGVRPILHTKMFHPANDHYGMSPIEAASVAIDIHNEASKWNKALLDNSARPSGALVYAAANGQMTGEQFQRLKDELETSYQGARHAGRPLLLEGGLDWKPLSLSPKDMDFIEAKNSAAREIALAMGVPPQLLGIPGDSTYSNYAEAQRAFWRGTVLPLVNRMSRAFGSWLSPAFGSVLEVRPDLDSVEALNPEREALWARLDAASFLTEDEKRAAAGYGAKGESETALKYSPDQPRVPAGDPDGGQWSDGGGGGSDVLAGGNGNDQLAGRFDALKPLAEQLGRMLSRTPKVIKPSEKPLHDLIKPGGKELGIKRGGAREGIRTLERKEFDKLKSDMLDGAEEIVPREGYSGKVFRRPDGTEIGIRESKKFGETIDVLKSTDETILKNGFKIHAND